MENEKRYLIVGLGNAEQQYAGTRHNYGFEVANAVAAEFKTTFKTGWPTWREPPSKAGSW